MHNDLVTAAEVAERFSIDRTTLLRWIGEGRIAVHRRIGVKGAYIFQQTEVDRVASELAGELEAKLARLQPATETGGTAA